MRKNANDIRYLNFQALKNPLLRLYAGGFFLATVLASCQLSDPGEVRNPIVSENKRQGTTEWMLTNSQTDTCSIVKPYSEIFLCRSKPIEGYGSATSVKAGEALQVFVSTDPPSPFTVDIFRMGYYHVHYDNTLFRF